MTTKLTKDNIDNLKNFAVSWQSVITADGSTTTSLEAGKGYFIDTTSNTHTVVLPTNASIGDIVRIKDYAGTFNTNNLTIDRNGHNIQGVDVNGIISDNRASISLFYVNSTKGWLFSNESNIANLGKPLFTVATGGTITTSGDYKIHTFTGDGSFIVSTLGNSPVVPTGGPSNVDYLVVAGGGGGGIVAGGGGGAGGYRTSFPSPGCNAGAFPISATTYPITVGGGGSKYTVPCSRQTNGSDSIFSTITSTGGGRGGPHPSGSPTRDGAAGGSGGGSGGSDGAPGAGSGGAGNTPPTSPSQGNPGGNGDTGPAPERFAGGGGGATATGQTGPAGGDGGAGAPNSITGTVVTYAGGGGGGSEAPSSPRSSTGGAGGGGDSPNTSCAQDGTANTGGGGGGYNRGSRGGSGPSGAGGKGIVIIRYKYQ